MSEVTATITNLEEFNRKVREYLVRRVEAALKAIGEQTVAKIEDAISVPVDFSTSPPTRSKSGEPPRLDTGELRDNVTFTVTSTPQVYTLEVTVYRPSTPGLVVSMEDELGMNRPIVRPIFYGWLEPNAVNLLISNMEKA